MNLQETEIGVVSSEEVPIKSQKNGEQSKILKIEPGDWRKRDITLAIIFGIVPTNKEDVDFRFTLMKDEVKSKCRWVSCKTFLVALLFGFIPFCLNAGSDGYNSYTFLGG